MDKELSVSLIITRDDYSSLTEKEKLSLAWDAALESKELAQQQLTQQGSEPTEISVDVIWRVIGERYSGKIAVELIQIMQQQQKHLPC